jgi:septal ring factor EnvC (AmiA/AmiB activator)
MPQDKANLARIRDNQRRSRAQRKEYLQQLETRLRQIEQQGIDASLEIQVAARRVADENRKLRRLLVQHGVSDDTTMAFLRSHSSAKNRPDAVGEGQFKDAVHGGLGIQIFEQPGGCRGPGYGRVDRRESGSG